MAVSRKDHKKNCIRKVRSLAYVEFKHAQVLNKLYRYLNTGWSCFYYLSNVNFLLFGKTRFFKELDEYSKFVMVSVISWSNTKLFAFGNAPSDSPILIPVDNYNGI
jgi:hypothetical protein